MSDPPAVVVKEKNPKRVAAGKKLAEKNKMYKEHFEKTSSASESASDSAKPMSSASDTSYYFIGAIVLAVAGIVYYQSRPKRVEKPRPLPMPEPVKEPSQAKPNRTINM